MTQDHVSNYRQKFLDLPSCAPSLSRLLADAACALSGRAGVAATLCGTRAQRPLETQVPAAPPQQDATTFDDVRDGRTELQRSRNEFHSLGSALDSTEPVDAVRLLRGGSDELICVGTFQMSSGVTAEIPAPCGVPAGFVGRFERSEEFATLEQYAAAVTAAIEARSRTVAHEGGHSSRIERVALESLGEVAFLQRWARRGRPVVLTGCLTGWDIVSTWNPTSLRERYGDQPWTARRGRSYEVMESVETTLGEYLDHIAGRAPRRASTATGVAADSFNRADGGNDAAERTQSAADAQFYGANNFVPPGLVNELRLPPFFPPHVKRLGDTRLWIGPPSCGVHLHRDLQDNFLLQVFGRKRVTLIAPHHAAALNARMVTPFLHTTDVDQRQDPPAETEPVTVVLQAGDMLYLPAGYFHATETIGEEGGPQEAQGAGSVGCSLNFFLSACFASLGVIVPRLPGAPPDWLGQPPPDMVSLADAID